MNETLRVVVLGARPVFQYSAGVLLPFEEKKWFLSNSYRYVLHVISDMSAELLFCSVGKKLVVE